MHIGWEIEYGINAALCAIFLIIYLQQFFARTALLRWCRRHRAGVRPAGDARGGDRERGGMEVESRRTHAIRRIGPCQLLFFRVGFVIILLQCIRAVDPSGVLGYYKYELILLLDFNICLAFYICGAGLIHYAAKYYTKVLQRRQSIFVRFPPFILSLITFLVGNSLPFFRSAHPNLVPAFLLWLSFAYLLLAVLVRRAVGVFRSEIRKFTRNFGTSPLTVLTPGSDHYDRLEDEEEALGRVDPNRVDHEPEPFRLPSGHSSVQWAKSTAGGVGFDAGPSPSSDNEPNMDGLLSTLSRLQLFLILIFIFAAISMGLRGLALLGVLPQWPAISETPDPDDYQITYLSLNWVQWLGLGLILRFAWYKPQVSEPASQAAGSSSPPNPSQHESRSEPSSPASSVGRSISMQATGHLVEI